MRRTKVLSAISLSLFLMAGFLSPQVASAQTEITLAYQGPLTGSSAEYGIAQYSGVRYAIEKFNAGSQKYRVKSIAIDDQGSSERAKDLAPTVVADKDVLGLIGPAFTNSTRLALPYYKAAKLAVISPSASHWSLTDPSSNWYGGPVFHRVVAVNFGPALARYAIKDVESPRVYLVDASNLEAGSQASAIRKTLSDQKLTLVGNEASEFNISDHSTTLSKIKAAAANVVIYLGFADSAGNFLKQLRDSGSTAIFSYGDVAIGSDFLTTAGKAAEGSRIVTSTRETMEELLPNLAEDFTKVIKAKPGYYSLEAIDATNIMLECISRGNTARDSMLACVKSFKGKNSVGAEISFDDYGDVVGSEIHTATVKNLKLQFGDVIPAEEVARQKAATDSALIDVTSISSRSIIAGEQVVWKYNVTVQPGWLKGIYTILIEPNGQARQLFLELNSRFKNYYADEAETFEINLPLQTHSGLTPGNYSIAHICLEGENQACITDPRYSKRYNSALTFREVDLSEFSFDVKASTSTIQDVPLRATKVSVTKKSYSPGEVLTYEVLATGTMKLSYASMSIEIGDLEATAFCNSGGGSNCSFIQDSINKTTKVTFTFPLPEDLPPGVIEVRQVYLSSSLAPSSSSGSIINNTSTWNSAFNYSDDSTVDESGRVLPASESLDFTELKSTLLDGGGVQKRTPTWVNPEWSANKVVAGTDAVLTLDVNGYQRYVSAIYMYNLISSSGNIVSVKDPRVSRQSPQESKSIYPLTKNGRYQIKVSIPRAMKPGFYRIGQLTVTASNCDAKDQFEWSSKTQSGTGQCTGLNQWETTYYNGNLKGEIWPGYEKTPALTIEVLPAVKPLLPELTVASTEPTSIRIDYPYDYELDCSFTADQGSLFHGLASKGTSTNGLNNLVLTDLKPDSRVRLTGTCTGTDGLVSDPTVVEFRSAKPIPPAAPKVTSIDVGVDYAKFEFNYRDGYSYSIKTNSGEVALVNGTVQISRLSPNSKVEFQISITDLYGQTTTGDAITFTTKKPTPPTKPVVEVVSKSQSRISLKIVFDPLLSYEFSSDIGSISLSSGQVSISGLQAGEKVIFQATATDKYGQWATFEEIFQSALPAVPRTPSLRSESILPTEINLLATRPANTKLLIKSSIGVVTVDGDRIKVTGLSPKSSVTVTASAVDQFGQTSSATVRKFTTSTVARQKTISCTNGKTDRVVLGVNPTCPPGFRKK